MLTKNTFFQDVCKTSIFYADHMCRRVSIAQKQQQQQQQQHPQSPQQQGENQNQPRPVKFVVTPGLCLAINNIDYVLQFIKPFSVDLGVEETLDR